LEHPARQRTKSQKIAEEALEIEAEEARAAGALGFMARILVQATLPHSRPKTHEFERVNGRFTLYMNAPPPVGLPYGSYPRLALAWLSTEAVRTRSREIELGPTFSSFMYKLGLTPVTGKRGTTSRLRSQLHRLFSTTIRCSWESGDWDGRADGRDSLSPVSCAGVGYTIAHKHELWWSPRDPEATTGLQEEVPGSPRRCPARLLRGARL
jgi:hypothetical protein